MLSLMTTLLERIPFWVWVLLPIALLAVVTYLVTHNKRTTRRYTLSALGIAWGTAGFHFWEVFLHEHFLGSYNAFGLPDNFSRSGWALMLDAWPLWLIPGILFTLMGASGFWWAQKYVKTIMQHQAEEEEIAAEAITTGISSAGLVQQLEVQKLKRQLKIAKDKMNEIKKHANTGALDDTIKKLKREIKLAEQKHRQYDETVQQLNADVKRSKNLIERLLDERLESNRRLRELEEQLEDDEEGNTDD